MMQQEISKRTEIRHRRALRAAGMGVGTAIGIGVGGFGAPVGGGGSTGGPTDPITIVTSATCLAFFSADLGRTIATGVSSWADQVPSSTLTAVQATGGAQPTVVAASINGHDTLRFTKASAQRLVIGTLNIPAPGTTPTFFWGVAKPVTLAANDTIFGGGTSTAARLLVNSSTLMRASNGTSSSTVAATAGQWYRYELLFNNSAAADYLKWGGTTTGVGTALGNNDPAAGAMTIGAQQTAGTNPGDFELGCWGIWNAKPSGAETTALDAWVAGYYGGTISI